ncbi:MAG: SBBP repeat-containing protein, partial [Candidatus Hodarchaeales archaeon]
DFPTLNAYNSTYSGGEYNGDGFLAKFSADGQLLFSTFVGGSEYESISSVVLDASGNIILAGRT